VRRAWRGIRQPPDDQLGKRPIIEDVSLAHDRLGLYVGDNTNTWLLLSMAPTGVT